MTLQKWGSLSSPPKIIFALKQCTCFLGLRFCDKKKHLKCLCDKMASYDKFSELLYLFIHRYFYRITNYLNNQQGIILDNIFISSEITGISLFINREAGTLSEKSSLTERPGCSQGGQASYWKTELQKEQIYIYFNVYCWKMQSIRPPKRLSQFAGGLNAQI